MRTVIPDPADPAGERATDPSPSGQREAEMYQRILVPLDGSETAEKVLPVAQMEASCHGAVLILLRTIPPLRSSLMVTPAILDQLDQHAREISTSYLDTLAERLRAEGFTIETEIRLGPPAEQILRFAEESQCDLIIIGTRGETGATRWKFGGVANKIIKTRTTMPVLVVNT